jgi:hypothetical protein
MISEKVHITWNHWPRVLNIIIYKTKKEIIYILNATDKHVVICLNNVYKDGSAQNNLSEIEILLKQWKVKHLRHSKFIILSDMD